MVAAAPDRARQTSKARLEAKQAQAALAKETATSMVSDTTAAVRDMLGESGLPTPDARKPRSRLPGTIAVNPYDTNTNASLAEARAWEAAARRAAKQAPPKP